MLRLPTGLKVIRQTSIDSLVEQQPPRGWRPFVWKRPEPFRNKFTIRKGPWLPFHRAVEKSLFKKELIYLVTLYFKSKQIEDSRYASQQFNYDLEYQQKNLFYLFFYILYKDWVKVYRTVFFLDEADKYYYFVFDWSFFVPLEHLQIPFGIVRYKANFFSLRKFRIKKCLCYSRFNTRIKMFHFGAQGIYLEYFRRFKYLNYIKRLPNKFFSPQSKYYLIGRMRYLLFYRLPFWKYFRWEIYDEDSTVIHDYNHSMNPEGTAYQIFTWISYFKPYMSKLAFKLPFLFRGKFRLLLFHSLHTLFALSLVWFSYRHLLIFKVGLTHPLIKPIFKFKCSNPTELMKILRLKNYDLTLWIIRYNLKQILERFIHFKINYYYLIDKEFKFFDLCNLMFIEMLDLEIHKKVIPQFYWEKNLPMSVFFVRLWHNFSCWGYFWFTSAVNYYIDDNEFNYWLSFYKYSLDSCSWLVYSPKRISLSLQLQRDEFNRSFLLNKRLNLIMFNSRLEKEQLLKAHKHKYLFLADSYAEFSHKLLYTTNCSISFHAYLITKRFWFKSFMYHIMCANRYERYGDFMEEYAVLFICLNLINILYNICHKKPLLFLILIKHPYYN